MNFRVTVLGVILLLISCNKSDSLELIVDNKIVDVEVAATHEERQKGLMERDHLGEDSGMIFVFDIERRVSFWMKNTSIPLSIAYIDKRGTILEIYDLEPYSLESISSKRSSIKYALEVNRGYFSKNSIEVGDKIELEPLINYLNSSR